MCCVCAAAVAAREHPKCHLSPCCEYLHQMLTVCMCSRLRDQPLSDKAFDTLGDLLRGMQHCVSFKPCNHLDLWIAVLSSILSLPVLCNLYLLVHSFSCILQFLLYRVSRTASMRAAASRAFNVTQKHSRNNGICSGSFRLCIRGNAWCANCATHYEAGDWRDNRLSYFKTDSSCYQGAPSCLELRASRIVNRVELLVMT